MHLGSEPPDLLTTSPSDPLVCAHPAALIATRPLKQWRETLAILATYSDSGSWGDLCDQLARKLLAAGSAHAASLCWICAADVDPAVQQWSLQLAKSGTSVRALQVT